MAESKGSVSLGSRNVIFINGDRYYGEVAIYSKEEEETFNFDNTDMVSVGNDNTKKMFLPAAQCRFDNGQAEPHMNAVNCDVVVEADANGVTE